jgi:hypothetical protein
VSTLLRSPSTFVGTPLHCAGGKTARSANCNVNMKEETFDPAHAQAEVRPIFKWYRKDFDSYPGGLERSSHGYALQPTGSETGSWASVIDRRLCDLFPGGIHRGIAS